MNDLGVSERRLRIETDASVTPSLASRSGVVGIRHVEIEKVKGIINRADALTKPKPKMGVV